MVSPRYHIELQIKNNFIPDNIEHSNAKLYERSEHSDVRLRTTQIKVSEG